MTDNDLLSDAQLAEFRTALLTLQTDLQAEIDNPSGSADTVDLDQPIGRISRVDAIQQQRMVQAQHRRLKGRLAQVRTALRAVEDDEYGDCRRCGELIKLGRLEARPETPLCVTCQAVAERRR